MTKCHIKFLLFFSSPPPKATGFAFVREVANWSLLLGNAKHFFFSSLDRLEDGIILKLASLKGKHKLIREYISNS